MNRKLISAQYEEIKLVVHREGFTGHGTGVHTRDGYTIVTWSDHGPCFTIHLNADMPVNRRRFTLAHELGHILLDHFLSTCTLDVEEQEGAANYFASCLLAPVARVLMLPEVTVAAVADTFVLSSGAAKHAHNRALRAMNRAPSQTLYDHQLTP
ncbi:ImmA/IrrE family metallo-endopeptidase [uncultured Corynebacterium sp.]|uniref:ImmA/IrrE family metallo-endopeptidase n=1 Tax=uncultured Corynebacterium sp. TaxID=159447 RepID=UPI0025FB8962|nr:ImmA/IrrE family metallo-endopeptidase [uncultured Corynebacterium sp.]